MRQRKTIFSGQACWQMRQRWVVYAMQRVASQTGLRRAPVGQASSQRWQSAQGVSAKRDDVAAVGGVELLVVLGILVILVVLVSPSSIPSIGLSITISPRCTMLPRVWWKNWWLRPMKPSPAFTAQRRSKKGAESQKRC